MNAPSKSRTRRSAGVQDLSAQDFFEELHGAGIVRAAQDDHRLPVVLGGAAVRTESAQRANWKHGSYSAAATLLISNGENVKVAQSQLRHTTPKITLELYAQAVSADQQKAHKKVVRMVLPLKFPQKLRAKSEALTV